MKLHQGLAIKYSETTFIFFVNFDWPFISSLKALIQIHFLTFNNPITAVHWCSSPSLSSSPIHRVHCPRLFPHWMPDVTLPVCCHRGVLWHHHVSPASGLLSFSCLLSSLFWDDSCSYLCCDCFFLTMKTRTTANCQDHNSQQETDDNRNQ